MNNDEENSTKSGMDNFNLKSESEFLKRLQHWNSEGNRQYRPSCYKNLTDLPMILIVSIA